MTSSAAEIHDEIQTQIFHSEETRAEIHEHVHEVADRAATFAQSIAPVGQTRDPHPGQFRDSIHVEDAPDYNGLPAAAIWSRDPNAVYIEYGTGKTPEHATFARTAQQFDDETGVHTWVGIPEYADARYNPVPTR